MESSDSQPPFHPLLGLFLGVLSVSTASIFIRFAQIEAPSIVIAAYRLSIATLILAPIVIKRNFAELRNISPRDLAFASISGLFLALHFATWITSLEYTSVASSVVLVTTTPLWVALFVPFTLKESLAGKIKVGMLLSLIGGVIIGVSDTCTWKTNTLQCPPISIFYQGEAFYGDMLAVIGAILAACYLLIGRRLREKMSLLTYIFLVYGMAAACLIILVISLGYEPFAYKAPTYLWFVLLALIPQLLGHSSFNWALRYLSVVYVSITLLGEPIGSTLLAYFLLSETPSGLKLFGAILILAGIYTASLSEVKQMRTTSSTI